MKYSAYSAYLNIDDVDNKGFELWITHHKRLKHPPKYVTVYTGAKYTDAYAILDRLHKEFPLTNFIWRGHGKYFGSNVDDGNLWLELGKKFSPTEAALAWYNNRIAPHMDMIKRNNIVIMTTNEADPITNIRYEIEAIKVCGERGIRLASPSWATGVPDYAVYDRPEVIELVKVMAKYKTVMRLHEYCGKELRHRSGLLDRYEKLLNKFKELGLALPDIVIGEFGLVVATDGNNGEILLDPYRGHRFIMSGKDYADFVRAIWQAWYKDDNVYINVFSWGPWGIDGSFRLDIDTDFQRDMEDNPLEINEGTMPTKYNAIVNTASLRLRSGPGTNSNIVVTMKSGESLVVEPHNEEWYRVIEYKDQDGKAYNGYAALPLVKLGAAIVDPPPPPPPPPDPNPLPEPIEEWFDKLTREEWAKVLMSVMQMYVILHFIYRLLEKVFDLHSNTASAFVSVLNEAQAVYKVFSKLDTATLPVIQRMDEINVLLEAGRSDDIRAALELSRKPILVEKK